MKIHEVLARMEPRPVPCVHGTSKIEEVIKVIAQFPHTRLVYVVDDERKLVGSITVGSILRHIFPHHYEAKIHAHGMLRRITAETAEHIMDKKDVHTAPNERVVDVLTRMAETGLKEMAVLDETGRIVADITVADLLKHFHLKQDDYSVPE